MSDTKDFREQFKGIADEFRRRKRKLKWIAGSVMLFLGLVAIFGDTRSDMVFYGLLGTFFVSLITLIAMRMGWLPTLACPACQSDMDLGLGGFCPECGGSELKKNLLGTKCNACGRSLDRSKYGRQYKVRFCSYCDAHVDDEGV
jgi:hypothetical protein